MVRNPYLRNPRNPWFNCACLLLVGLTCWSALPPLPPPVARTNALPARYVAAKPVHAASLLRSPVAASLAMPSRGSAATILPPGIILSWDAPPGACYVIQATTNLQTWYWKTNVPLTATNIFIPQTPGVNAEFYRARTCLPNCAGSFTLGDLSVFTNTP